MPCAPLYPVEMLERLREWDGRSETSRMLDRSGVARGESVEKASLGLDMLL